MKRKLTTLFASCLFFSISYGQMKDSIRTRNGKPGTPQSLRKPNTAPKTHVHTIDKNAPPQQTIHHCATEHNDPANLDHEKEIAPNSTFGKKVPVTPVTIEPGLTPKDTSKNNKGVMQNGESNATNPIRK